ncbi:hypothetical protein E3Q22_01720 [Wallemia mellicola]|uniref:Uncharacterized protein n=2 Tax=Wallemia mellicola TaxID=1708541 RepID=A0A4T0NAJ4_9BASI|nr:hypothetical protein WALSEDRAFT_69873 [Wallemia mellicola CBS 633.66]TIB77892.1 hypothetical protein E3Q23_01111 [Wallemia mellicola]EIM20297.1 hypothetical protein WALSEDRAFT_69873 [Wallemia mellicola CBS 633.66]TIB80845.1 hypothetical protein E3Q22_01720 [Wallemia mellicola]TIB93187.1 hypothetical protein E3Q19_01478 [Wallemia mellicola]TIB99589.1 hypothetical protein E3Q18_01525 [Wallemia mellicola]|eukprot:XP_006959554.1 hypothetical protein WALSEDRAFT_69873 [Wallemia mellicola CBS 633.66]
MVRSDTNAPGRLRQLARRSTLNFDDTLSGLPSAPLGPGWRSAAADLLATGEAAVQRRRSIRHLRRSATVDNPPSEQHSEQDLEKLPLHVHDNNEGVFVDGEGPMFPDIRIRFHVDPPNSIIMTLNNSLYDDQKSPDSFLLTRLELVVPYKSDGLVFASLDKITVEDLSVYDSQCLPVLERYSSQLKQPLGPGIDRKIYPDPIPSTSSFAPIHYHSSQSQTLTRRLEDPVTSPRPHKKAKKNTPESPPPLLPFPTTVTPCAYFNSYTESIESVPFAPPQRLTIDLQPGRATRYLAIRFLNSHGSRFDASRVKAFGYRASKVYNSSEYH